MSLASVITGFRKRIQALERATGRLERRLGTELPPAWEAKKLAINPLNLNYTSIVPLVFGGSSGNADTCSRMRFVDGRLLADPDDRTYGFGQLDTGSPRFTPFPGAVGWGIPYTPDGVPGFLVLWHQGMGMPVWITGCVGKIGVSIGAGDRLWWAFDWTRQGEGVGWDFPLSSASPGCEPAMLRNSDGLSEHVYYSMLTTDAWPESSWLYVTMQHTARGFFFDCIVAPTIDGVIYRGMTPPFDYYAIRAGGTA